MITFKDAENIFFPWFNVRRQVERQNVQLPKHKGNCLLACLWRPMSLSIRRTLFAVGESHSISLRHLVGRDRRTKSWIKIKLFSGNFAKKYDVVTRLTYIQHVIVEPSLRTVGNIMQHKPMFATRNRCGTRRGHHSSPWSKTWIRMEQLWL